MPCAGELQLHACTERGPVHECAVAAPSQDMMHAFPQRLQHLPSAQFRQPYQNLTPTSVLSSTLAVLNCDFP